MLRSTSETGSQDGAWIEAWCAVYGITRDQVLEYTDRKGSGRCKLDDLSDAMPLSKGYELLDVMHLQPIPPIARERYKVFLDTATARGYTNMGKAKREVDTDSCGPTITPQKAPPPPDPVAFLERVGVPSYYASLTKLTLGDVDKPKYDRVRSWVDLILKGDDQPRTGLYIHSPVTGNGKTSAATGAFRRIVLGMMEKNGGVSALWTTETALFRRLNDAMFDRTDSKFAVKDLVGYDVLMIDDLGRQKPTEHVRTILHDVFDSRQYDKPTIVTSNLSVDRAHLDPATKSRLYGAFLQIEFKHAVDARRQKAEVA